MSDLDEKPGKTGVLEALLGDEILTHAIFPFLQVNDQTNLCLTSKGMLAVGVEARRRHGPSAAATIVWEERAPTQRSFSICTFEPDLMLDNGRVCVGQEQQFRFQLQTVEFGHLVVRIHLQNDLWDEQYNTRDGPACRDLNDFPSKTLVNVIDIFQPPATTKNSKKFYRLFAVEVHPGDHSCAMLRRSKSRESSLFYILQHYSLADMTSAPEDLSTMTDTEQILRSSLQYFGFVLRRLLLLGQQSMEWPTLRRTT